jgi:hypothetical protein
LSRGGKLLQTQTTAPPTVVKKATAGFIISLIAGIIILINALFIFALSSFVGSIIGSAGISGVTDVVAAGVVLYGAIGLLFAIIVIVGAIMIYMPGRETIGGILVLIFSILSIIIGGGFFIGLILGIIGGALGLAKK